MKKKVAILVGIALILVPVIIGSELPSAKVELPHEEDIKIGSFDDQFVRDFSAPVSVRTGQTYVEEIRTVEIIVKPEIPRFYEEKEEVITDENHFLRVFVSIIFLDTGEEFEGYLYYEGCNEPEKKQLFWGNVSGKRVGPGLQIFDKRNPLVKSDEYFQVIIDFGYVTSSNQPCITDPAHDVQCKSSSDCLLYYMNSLNLHLSIDYTTAQKSARTQTEIVSDHEEKVDEEIESPETEARIRNVLIYIVVIAALAMGGGAVISLRKRKAQDVTAKSEKASKPQALEDTQSKPKTLACPLCKNEIQENWALCPYCGVRLKEDTQIY